MSEDKNTLIGQMVEVPAGPFMMGKDTRVEITLDAFLIDICPVTNAQFKNFIKACQTVAKRSRDRDISEYLLPLYMAQGIDLPKRETRSSGGVYELVRGSGVLQLAQS